MSTRVNPPPQVRIPRAFYNDPEVRAFFEEQRTILFQLWKRTGGSRDAVAGKQVVIAFSGSGKLDNSAYGALIVVEADSAPVSIILPAIAEDNVGETVDIAVIDATYETTILPAEAAETIFGEPSVTMNKQWESIQFTAVTENLWIAT